MNPLKVPGPILRLNWIRHLQNARALKSRDLRTWARLAALCTLVGLIAGAGAAGFLVGLDAARAFCMEYLAGYALPAPGHENPIFSFGSLWENRGIVRWMLFVLPVVGGLISGILIFWLAPEAEGHGTDAAIEAYHYKDGAVRRRVPIVKAITSMITIGSGGSGGREGPIAQIGSGFGSMLSRWTAGSPNERRILMAAGMAAGIGAIFHAPLAGALFAAEVLYQGPDFEHEVLVPGFVSSIVAYSVFGGICGFGFHPLFMTPGYEFRNILTLGPYLALGLVCGIGAIMFIRMFFAMRRFMFGRLHIPNHFKPCIGGILTGVVGFFIPEALGTGYGVIQTFFNDELSALPSAEVLADWFPGGLSAAPAVAGLLVVLAAARMATTTFTIGSGGSGGVFGPSVIIGGALGGATGLISDWLFPNLGIQPGAFLLVGMGGFFAGAANTPVSTIIMISEMTGNYNLLLPSMLVCIVAYAVSRKWTIYDKQLPSRLDAPSKLGNMATAILRSLTVRQVLDQRTSQAPVELREDMSFPEIVERFSRSSQSCFPVVDEQKRLTGVISANNIRRVLMESGLAEFLIARDFEAPVVTVDLQDSLLAAINKMITTESEELVVSEKADGQQKIVGLLSRSDVIIAYNRQITGPGLTDVVDV